MGLQRLLFLFVVGLFGSLPLCAAPTHDSLSTHDIHRVMDRLLDYHVEVRSLSGEVLRRSYEVYIDQFDPQKIYLLEEEVAPYLLASSEELESSLIRYQASDFSDYEALNQLITSAIYRARSWRYSLANEARPGVAASHTRRDPRLRGPSAFAKNEEELRVRQRNHMAKFAERQIKPEEAALDLDGALQITWALYEKKASSLENPYLFRDSRGNPLDQKEREHLLVLRTLKALAKSLDSHTAYYSPQEAYQMKMQLQRAFVGIGVVLEDGIGGVVVARVIKGGPADKSGELRVQDRIVEIEGRSIAEDSFEEVLERLQGPKGSSIRLGVVRKGQVEGDVRRIALMREAITLDETGFGATYEYFGEGIIGVVRLDSFYEGSNGLSSERDVRHAVREFKKRGKVIGLVLDLRGNLGGFLSQAVKVAGLFITNGVIAMSKYSDGVEVYFRDIDGHAYYDGPLVILTSKASASAAEIVAQALQDYGQAVVVGDTRTYGKGSIQHQTITDDNADTFFKVTVGRYYTVSGKSTQITGVQADIVVPTLLAEEPLGEEFLEYPLAADQIAPAFEDTLQDLTPGVRQWFVKYYLPTLQKRKTVWQVLLPSLRKNSEHRLKTNRNFQLFLQVIQNEEPTLQSRLLTHGHTAPAYGLQDLQLEESINILKDMIFLESTVAPEEAVAEGVAL